MNPRILAIGVLLTVSALVLGPLATAKAGGSGHGGGKGGGGATAQCGDGVDNDGDGLIDYPADPGCSSKKDNDESNAAPPAPACNDGKDNDGDGKTDYPADPGCSSRDDTDEFNFPAKSYYFHKGDPVSKVWNLELPMWSPPDAEPADATRPTGTESAKRPFAIAYQPKWNLNAGAVWDIKIKEKPYLTAEVWASVGPGSLGAPLQLWWADYAVCIDPIVSCYAPATYGPVALNHVTGTGQVLADGSILEGQFTSASVPLGTCFQSLEFCHYAMAYVEVAHPTAAGLILYDGAATPSCVSFNAAAC